LYYSSASLSLTSHGKEIINPHPEKKNMFLMISGHKPCTKAISQCGATLTKKKIESACTNTAMAH
jgi:hypothetical protein